jgi:hypothetical protein
MFPFESGKMLTANFIDSANDLQSAPSGIRAGIPGSKPITHL